MSGEPTGEQDPFVPIPPHNLDAEESVLGAMMLDRPAVDAVVDEQLKPGDFYRESHAVVFRAMLALHAVNEPVDAITVADALERSGELALIAGGKGRIHEIAALVPSSSNVRHYTRIVKDKAIERGLTRVGEVIQRLGWAPEGRAAPELLEEAERVVFDLAQARQRSEFTILGDVLSETFTRLEDLSSRGLDVIGCPSGFAALDNLTAGFQPGNLVVVAARPSMGKSAFALGIAAHVSVKCGRPAALFTMEMSKWEVTQRLLSSEAHVDSVRLRNGRLEREQWVRLYDAHSALKAAPLLIDDAGSATVSEVRSKARRAKLKYPDLAVVIVDYLQLMSAGGRVENRVQEVSQISRALKMLAGELQVPVVALSQLSREPEKRHDKRPLLSDLRESGSIEQDADAVLFLYRDEYYHPDDAAADGTEGVAEVNLAKQRNGPTGIVKLAFVKRYAQFGDLAP